MKYIFIVNEKAGRVKCHYCKSDSNKVGKDESVIYDENNNSNKSPFVVSNYMPKVEGVAVIAKGGDSPLVKEKITGIIKALFGIEINKIAVGKMK